MAVVKQNAYITIHDKSTTKSQFTDHPKDNGLGILQPSVCRITEVLNGMYELYIEHPIVKDDPRAGYIKVDNIIRADGQLFRIRKTNKKLTQSGDKVITADALHIWYDLADRGLPYYNCDGHSPYWFIQNMDNALSPELDLQYLHPYFFEGTSGMGVAEPLAYAIYKNTNPVAALIGTENAFISIYQKEENGEIITPELWRDNFQYRLDWRKHDAVDNAFSIRQNIDMTDVSVIYDIQELCTSLFASDNFGHTWSERIDPTAIIASGGWLPAHHRTRYVKFQYNTDENDQYIENRFKQDVKRYFNSVSNVKISITCNYAELSNTTLYKDYIEAKHCNVGDTGTIECEDLGLVINNAKVTKKVKDVLKNETTSITFGSKAASLTDPGFMVQTIDKSKF